MEDKPVKILMTADTLGGVWTYCIDLCEALQSYNIEVHLATMGRLPNDDQKKQVNELQNVHLYSSSFQLEWMENPWDDVSKAGEWLLSLANEIRPELIHFNNYGQVNLKWPCPVITVFHSCVQTWWMAVKEHRAPDTWNRYKLLVQHALDASDVVVSPSASLLEEAGKIYHITSDTKVIYNGRKTLPSEELQEMPKERFIFSTGRVWDDAKNMQMLPALARKSPWPLYVAGNNKNPSTGKRIDLQNVLFLGKLTPEGVQNWLQKASIFVSPTKYEPFGLAVLEAAQAGCALLLSKIDTLEEIWGESAVYFDPNRPEEAQEKLKELIKDEDKLSALVKKSMKRAENFSRQKMADNYFSLYTKLLSSEKVEINHLSHSA